MAKRFEKYQNDALNLAFKESEHLTKEKKLDLVRVTGLDMEQVTNWFNRKRARKRGRDSMQDLELINAGLKQSLQECQEKVAKLQKELEQSKQTIVETGIENENLKRRKTIAEGDLLFDPVIWLIHGNP